MMNTIRIVLIVLIAVLAVFAVRGAVRRAKSGSA